MSEVDQPEIESFHATFHHDQTSGRLHLDWRTRGAAYCLIEGYEQRLVPDADGVGAHDIVVTPDHPLQSEITLVAVGHDETHTARQTLRVRFVLESTPVELDNAYRIICTPDGTDVLALEAAGVAAFDAHTLERRSRPMLIAADGTGVDTFAIDTDGTTVYVLSFGGRVYAFERATGEGRDDGTYAAAGSEPPYHFTVMDDHAVLVTNEVQIDSRMVGANQLLLLDRVTFAPIYPTALPTDHTLIHVVGHESRRHFLGAPEGVRVLDHPTLAEPYAVIERTLAGMLALSPDETTLYSVAFDTDTRAFVLGAHDTATGVLRAETTVVVGFNPLFMALLGVPFAALQVSPDGDTLFMLGGEPEALRRNKIQTSLSVYDSATLEEVSWSPLTFGALLPVAIAVAPDGSRLFVIAGDRIGQDDATTWLFALDARFA